MGPLEGIKVLDLSAMVSGPVAATLLADQGAEVIKVEPKIGEQMRHMGKPFNGVPPTFYSCNRGKKSLAIDLKSSEGKLILQQLILDSDVLIQNFRPGAIDRMGFGEEAVRAINSKIIYVSISGFGEKGPYAHQRVYDPVIQALAGATDIQADKKAGRPKMFRVIIADKVTALGAAQAITAALFYRERSGKGQHIRLSMLDAMIGFLWPEGMSGLVYAESEFDPAKATGAMDLVFETLDGFITAGAVTDSQWQGMCRALNSDQLKDDKRFATSLDRIRHAEIRKEMTASEIARWKSEDILERLDTEGVPSAPLLKRTELLEHEQVIANETVLREEIEGFGEVRQARPPARFSATPSEIQAPAPKLGEHTDEILISLGFSNSKRETLRTKGVIL
ncbi:MAG: CaiB/BaiF CoA transferase family protein [Candidatus Azotimanducaceae bacterium]|uniref:CoA transferase n=1 Tax=OM182 bacterium TaxID=2510334 RepID=A0A520RYP3_9GAMM|nr:CoA transferase [Gammaproteobacteria bacterium]RZO75366.1 MAG: CoA transferase [OM182 bacterium]